MIVHEWFFRTPECGIEEIPAEDLEFFDPDTLEAAEARGFRACVHCLPYNQSRTEEGPEFGGEEGTMYRVVHFNIMADDTARAVKFYGDVFGWKAEGWPGMDYWLVTTGPDDQPGINGGIGPRRSPSERTENSIQVPSVLEHIKKVEAAGGKALTPKMPIPGVGWTVMCADTEGNTFGLFEEDPAAK